MESYIFTLLQRAMGFADGSEPISVKDWRSTVSALHEHALLGVSAGAIMSLPEESSPDAELRMFILQFSASLTQMHYTLDKTVCEVFSMMYAAGLHPILLKGQGLATLYPTPHTRSCGDIDVFLLPEEFDKGCGIIFDYCGSETLSTTKENGERIFPRYPNNIHLTAYKTKDVKFEIHYLPADTAIADIKNEYNEWMTEKMRQSDTVDINGLNIAVPCLQVNVVYVFEHILKHMRTEGVGLRQFLDWAVLLHHGAGNIDREQLKSDLVRFHLLDAWQVLGGILVWQLGLPKEEFPLWDERKAKHSQGRNLKYILYAGNLGEKLGEYKDYYYLPPSIKRDILALKYAVHYQRFMYHIIPYDTPRRVRNDIVRVIKEQIKRVFN